MPKKPFHEPKIQTSSFVIAILLFGLGSWAGASGFLNARLLLYAFSFLYLFLVYLPIFTHNKMYVIVGTSLMFIVFTSIIQGFIGTAIEELLDFWVHVVLKTFGITMP